MFAINSCAASFGWFGLQDGVTGAGDAGWGKTLPTRLIFGTGWVKFQPGFILKLVGFVQIVVVEQAFGGYQVENFVPGGWSQIVQHARRKQGKN